MLIHWDFTAEQLGKATLEQLRLLVDELIRVRRHGLHLVSISRQTVFWLIDYAGLTEFQSVQLQSISRSYTQTGNLRRYASRYIEISSFNHDYESGAGGAINLSINFILSNDILKQPRIITENIDNDGWLIEFVLRNVRGAAGVPAIKMHKLHGGGGDVIRVLKYEISEKSIVCAIVDSDKKFPLAEDGDKIVKAVSVCQEAGWPLAFVLQTPCHEIESFIPFSLVAEVAKHDNAIGIDRIWQIIKAEMSNKCSEADVYWRWFDIKSGISQKKIDSMPESEKSWHISKLNLINSSSKIRDIPGFGMHIVPRIVKEGKYQRMLSREMNAKIWPDTYREWFKDISWIFAAQNRTYT